MEHKVGPATYILYPSTVPQNTGAHRSVLHSTTKRNNDITTYILFHHRSNRSHNQPYCLRHEKQVQERMLKWNVHKVQREDYYAGRGRGGGQWKEGRRLESLRDYIRVKGLLGEEVSN